MADIIKELAAALEVVLDQVDYTKGACRINEMVGAVLDKSVIQQARTVLAKAKLTGGTHGD